MDDLLNWQGSNAGEVETNGSGGLHDIYKKEILATCLVDLFVF
jgi:hypothetical protein